MGAERGETMVVFVAESPEEYDELQALTDQDESLSMSIEEELEPQLIDGVTPVLIAGAVLAVTKVIMDWFDKRRGGTIIDRAVEPMLIQRSRGVPWGMVVIIASDGKVTVEVKDAPTDALERWVKEFLKLPSDAGAAVINALKRPKPQPAT